ncbi:MAG: site-2 protease family protein [Pirellulaceae bacterium]
MHDPFQWSISLGRWHGLTVRLHVLFVAFAIATMYLFWPTRAPGSGREANSYLLAAGQMLGIASAAIAVLFLSVLVHELSHWWAARRAGVAPDTIVIGPLGGLTDWPGSPNPRMELAIWSAGPLANLFLWMLLATALRIQQPAHSFVELLNPLQPAGLQVGTSPVIQVLSIALWINLLLFLVNSLPGFPFDGGRILRSALLVARPSMHGRQVITVIFWVTVTLSILMAAVALMIWKHGGEGSDSLSRAWLALLLLSVVLLVSARQEVEVHEMGSVVDEPGEPGAAGKRDLLYADSTASASLPAPSPADIESDTREEEEQEEEEGGTERRPSEEIEADEEKLVDGVLSRLHAHGMDSLTLEERALLQRVSARYRHRLGRRI